MTIYWDRCDICGRHRPTRKCSLFPDILVDIHCCFGCPHRYGKCQSPTWKIETPITIQPPRRGISRHEKERLLEELTSMLKGEK